MRLTSKTAYGVQALYDMAFHGGGRPVQAREVSSRQGIPLRYLEQILQELRRAGLVEGKRGPGGGYALARPPEELRLIAGLEQPDEGRVLVGGVAADGAPGGAVTATLVDGTHVPPQDRRVGFVFQSYALFGHMTVERNIAFGLKVRRVSPAETRRQVEELLAAVELEGYGPRYPSELS